jgi:hypothetical protein
MPIPSRATLKSYFETADVPTQAQFAAFIDAAYDMAQDATDASAAALAAVTPIIETSLRAIGAFTLVNDSNGNITGGATVLRSLGCSVSTAAPTGSTVVVTVTFDTANADADYVADVFKAVTALAVAAGVVINSKTAAGFVFTANMTDAGSYGTRYFKFQASR